MANRITRGTGLFGVVKANRLFKRGQEITASADELNLLDLSAVGALSKVAAIALPTPEDDSETPTGFVFPESTVVYDVFLNVVTKEETGATKTLDIGTDSTNGGDADGFGAGIAVSSEGLVRPQATVATGTTETHFSANNRGELLSKFKVGSDDAGKYGLYQEFCDLSSGGKEVTITAGSGDWKEFAGTLYVVYIELA